MTPFLHSALADVQQNTGLMLLVLSSGFFFFSGKVKIHINCQLYHVFPKIL